MYSCIQKENMEHSNLSDVLHSSEHSKPPLLLQIRRTVHDNQKPAVSQNKYRKPLIFTDLKTKSEISMSNADSLQSIALPSLNHESGISNSSPPKPNRQRSHSSSSSYSKSFPCEFCGKHFPQSYTLNRHIRTHTGEKPFPCDLCGRFFARSDKVLRHRRTHTGEKPFHCKTCEKTFARSDKLLQHERTHHKFLVNNI